MLALWGSEWLFWWQIPLLGLLAFGGGALLWVGGRFLARAPKATYWRSVGANLLAILAGALVVGVFTVAAGVLGGPSGAQAGLLLGSLAWLFATWWVIKAMFGTTLAKAALAWLPTLPQTALLVAMLAPTL